MTYVTNIQTRLVDIQNQDTTSKGNAGLAPPPGSGNLTPPSKSEVDLALANLTAAVRASGADGLGAPMALAKTLVNNEALLDRIGAIAENDRTPQMTAFLDAMQTAVDVGEKMIAARNTLNTGLSQLYDVVNVAADDQNADVVAEILRLIEQMSAETKRLSTSMSVEAMNHQYDSLIKAADNMLDAAQDRFKAAIAQAITQIASGAIQLGMGARAAQQGLAAASAKANAGGAGDGGVGQPMRDLASGGKGMQAAHLEASSQQWTTNARGTSDATSGVGGIFSAVYTLDAAEDENAAKLNEAAANMYGQSMQSAQTLGQSMADMMRQVVDMRKDLGKMDAELTKKVMS